MSALIPQYRDMAAGGTQFRGLSILQHSKQIGALVKQHGARTLLDYGCGGGDAYKRPHRLHREWGLRWFEVTLYDPAFPDHDEKPMGQFDGVLCSDVVEHVPQDDVPAFLLTLFQHARKFVWVSFCCRPAKKFFRDGETNLHVTQQPAKWWVDRLCEAQAADGRKVPFTWVETP